MNHDLRKFPTNQHIRAACGLFLGALCAFQVGAQTTSSKISPAQFGRVWGTALGSGTQVVNYPGTAAAASELRAWGVPSAVNPVINNAAVWADIGKGLQLQSKASIPLAASKTGELVVDVVAKVKTADVVAGVGAVASLVGGPWGMALQGMVAVAAWYTASGITLDAAGNPIGPVDQTSTAYNHDLAPTVPYPSYASACTAWGVEKNKRGQAAGYSVSQKSSSPCLYGIYSEPGHTYLADNGPSISGPVTMTGQVIQPMTPQQAGDAMAKRDPPVGALKEILDKGVPVEVQQPTVTGPSSVPGPSTTTSTPAQNGQPASTTTTTPATSITYQGNTITIGPTTTTTSNTTNNVTTTTSTVADTTPTKDECAAHPKRNGCREDEFDTPTDKIPKVDKTITYQAENLGFAGGMCPNDFYMTPHGMHQQIRVINWIDNCNKITTYAKPMILALASFMGLMIIFGGGARAES